MDQPHPVPTSVSEVESLILALYNPGTAHTSISAIQDTLLRLQKSPEGWRLAQTLLDRPVHNAGDDQIKFFGALTIIVKLNTESSALSEDDARELLQNLVRWLIGSASDAAGTLSTQKLVHTLVTFFLYFSHLWPNCVRHLLLCLRTGQSTPPEDASQAPSVVDIVTGLDWRALRVALWFTNTLVTDVGKTNDTNGRFMAVHERLQQNAADVSALIHCGLTFPIADRNEAVNTRRESIKSLQAWILYAQRLPQSKTFLLHSLRDLIDPVVACLQDGELYEAAVELLSDTMTNYSLFFSANHYRTMASIFTSPWGEERLKQLLDGDFDFEPLQYGLLMLAYGDAQVNGLLIGKDESHPVILEKLASLLTAKGYPVAEDLIFVPALEFWATYVETLLDIMCSSDSEDYGDAWAPKALAVTNKVVGYCWQKIQYPPPKEFMSWDASDRAGFSNARKDVADLLQTVFTVAGRDMLSLFTNLLLQSIADQAWPQIEATGFCLAALSDCTSDDNSYDDLLDRVFSSPLFGLLSLGEAQLPVRLRQTALSLIERYSEYFERHAAQLPAALTLLFDAVATPALSAQASKAIATLCSSCRLLLTSEVHAFLQQYHILHGTPQLDPLAEERVVYAISALIQATADEKLRLGLAEELLSCILGDVEKALQVHMSLAESNNTGGLDPNVPLVAKALRQCEQLQQQQQQRDEELSSSAHAASDSAATSPAELVLQMVLIPLRCLAGMARGLQSTTEQHVIDLEKNGSGSNADDSTGGVRAEMARRLLELQKTVLTMLMAVQTSFARSSEVVEVFCSILRAGFSETEPGLFVFPPYMVTELLVRQTAQTTPYIGVLVNTAQAFVSSLRTGPGRDAAGSEEQEQEQSRRQSLKALVSWVLGLLQAQASETDDPELTQRGIEFVDRVMQKDAATLLRHEPAAQLEFFFLCTLKVLGGNEPLPKAAAADFWTTFLSCKPSDGDDATLSAMVSAAMEHLGPLLAQTLVHNMGGSASRSELDKLCEPLKKLVVYGVRSQAWLEQALTSPSFPSDRVTGEQKMMFLKKIVRLRGGRSTNNVVREFWMACRGTTFEYAS